MHHWHRLGSFIILICLLFACDQAHAGRFSISLGYGLKQIDGTDSDPDGDFDITAPAVSHIELTGPS